ncbi:MAG TPA: ubiquinol-cytochrome c reductase cytochrome b subunit [Trebonia sp.]
MEAERVEKALTTAGGAIDDRFGAAGPARRALGKAFPDQWSFFLGELALYSFIILILTGTFLALFFHPSMAEIVYHGSYTKLDGVSMSEAYASTLNISFDIRGGLLVRQIHHWAALVFLGAIAVHALRIFFTGAFRRPREVNWVIGTVMFALGAVEGFAGYSLPDDLLSGTGLRIAEGIMESIPIVGTYFTYFFFGGGYPGQASVPRLYIVHVLLIPGLILALVTAHLMAVWHQGHTQWPGTRQREHTEVGSPMYPLFLLKTTSLFLFTFGILTVLATMAQINPVWLFGPYDPLSVSNGSQPDWYFAFVEGALRLMPGVETNVAGHTIVWNVLVPAVLLPTVFFAGMIGYPFFERWVTGDRRPHQVLDRPRNVPARTGLGAAILVSAGVVQAAGGDDVIAFHLGLAVEDVVWVLRIGFFVFPVVAFLVTRRACVMLQRADRRRLRAGRTFAVVSQEASSPQTHSPRAGGQEADGTSPGRAYVPVSRPVSDEERERLDARRPDELIRPIPRHLVPMPTPGRVLEQVRARVNHYYLLSWLETPYKDGTPPETPGDHRGRAEPDTGDETTSRPDH